MERKMKMKKYIPLLVMLLTVAANAQNEDESIRRTVTLYNPYQPTLQEAAKRPLLPSVTDTATVDIQFSYDFTPGSFVPVYEVSPIKSAILTPEPLPELQNGYVSMGLGTPLSPFLELSISNGRSDNGAIGLFTRTYGSTGKITLENRERAYAGFMDNQAILYGRKYYGRGRFDADVDFRQMTRFAYGYNPDSTGYAPSKRDIRSNYYDVTGELRYFTMEPDSNDLNLDVRLKYNLFTSQGYGRQYNPGLRAEAGKNLFGLYSSLNLDYDLYLFSGDIDTRSRNLFTIKPAISKGNEEWRFRFGASVTGDIRENYETLSGGDLKMYMYFYPDAMFTFRIIPHFLRFTASVDGSSDNNQARNAAYLNPWLVPGDTLYKLRSTDNQLRIAGGLSGSVNENSAWALDVSYTLFRDMLLFMNDTVSVGNYFVPLYSDGNLFRARGEVRLPLSRQTTLTLKANYYRYDLSGEQHAWHKPDWDGSALLAYNLRNKIIASADLTLTGRRFAKIMAPENIATLPFHPNLNLGVEYRYTPRISFWVKYNNISYNRYFEWNYYPSRNFLFLGGISYSL